MPDDLIDLPLGDDAEEESTSRPLAGAAAAGRAGHRQRRRRPRRRTRPLWPWWLAAGAVIAVVGWLLWRPPRLELTPATVPPLKAPVGESSEPVEIEVRNSGRRRVVITDLRVTGEDGFSIGRRDCAEEIPPGEACRVQVVLAPQTMGPKQTRLEIAGSQRGGLSALEIAGEGLGARLVAEMPRVEFGATPVDGQSSPRSIQVTNEGTLAGAVGSVSLGSREFRLTNNGCRKPLEPGESCTLEVVFRPRGLGVRQATLSAASEVAEPLAGVHLQGQGAGPGFEIRPAQLDFGEHKVGTVSPPQEVVWVNQGDEAWAVGTPRLDGDGFRLLSDTCARSPVPVDGSCTARVAFSPSAAGKAEGRLTLAHRNGERFPPAELTGVGTAAGLDFDLKRVGFPATPVGRVSPPRTLRLTNAGTAVAERVAIGIDGSGAASFRLSHDCGRILDVGATCPIRLSLSPRQGGEVSATVRVDSDDPNSPLTLPLVGNGASPRMVLSRDRLDFATVPQGESQELQLAIENPGSAALEIGAVEISGEGFVLHGDDCSGRMVVAGGDCALAVRFQPTRQGAHVGSVKVRSAAGSGVVSLSGLASEPPTPRVEIDPATIAFELTGVGDRSPVATITVTSRGPGSLTIQTVDIEGESRDAFSLVPGTCDLGRLVAGSHCSVGVRFQPASTGVHRATVVVRSNGEPTVHRVAVSGEAGP